MGVKMGQEGATPSQEHVLTHKGKSHLAPSLALAPAHRASCCHPGELLWELSSCTPTQRCSAGAGTHL